MVECDVGGRFVADLFYYHSQLNERGLALLIFLFHSTTETRVARFAHATIAATNSGGRFIGHGFYLCRFIGHGFYLFLCSVSFPFFNDLLSFIFL